MAMVGQPTLIWVVLYPDACLPPPPEGYASPRPCNSEHATVALYVDATTGHILADSTYEPGS